MNDLGAHLDELTKYLKQAQDAKDFPELITPPTGPPPIPPTPPRLVVLGPGGTGKSFLIRVLMLLVRKWSLARPQQSSMSQGILVAAPTGVAAFNIGGSTLHSLFSLPVENRGKSKFDLLKGVKLNAKNSCSKISES